ncbi:Uncharacterized protein TCM_001250 [Theobroma cacao]|uniref:Uncharacterized protein n=1 Tax=Theobroma cacao TaxID=3641 RepID=A0A061DIG2_THECC|nr:Uncharacterized protein TCM_001250 [Theobroma cacao]
MTILSDLHFYITLLQHCTPVSLGMAWTFCCTYILRQACGNCFSVSFFPLSIALCVVSLVGRRSGVGVWL